MPGDEGFYQAMAEAILDNSDEPMVPIIGADAAHRIEAHRGNYRTSVQSVIVSGYPVVSRIVGDEYMQGLAQAFVRDHPPSIASLTLYGDEFPAFLRTFAPVQNDLPWLSAVAELDRAWFAAYGAADTPPLDAKDLQGASHGALPLMKPGLAVSAQLLRFKVPAYSIWRTNKEDEQVKAIDLKKGAEWALVWRENNTVHHAALSRAEYVFLNNVEAGQSLAQAYSESCRFDRAFDLQQQFSRWLSAGLFKGEAR
ncbi:MAG: hypothetical protein COA47_11465 [Robiginitomaculum sp.]|nr:MAG: hypothetical protein COA47_11465 [Robiginitomaculum sp.]